MTDQTSPATALPTEWKAGNEFAPYHPQASHVAPTYRDGWNHCYREAQAAIDELRAEVERLKAAGALMAKTMFNLDRRGGTMLTLADCKIFKLMQVKWDVATTPQDKDQP